MARLIRCTGFALGPTVPACAGEVQRQPGSLIGLALSLPEVIRCNVVFHSSDMILTFCLHACAHGEVEKASHAFQVSRYPKARQSAERTEIRAILRSTTT